MQNAKCKMQNAHSAEVDAIVPYRRAGGKERLRDPCDAARQIWTFDV
jgi:hypothetical protein